jgi:uncharacterized protein with PIN domain
MLTSEQVRCKKCDAPCYANRQITATRDPITKGTRIVHTSTWDCTRCHEVVAERGK